MRKYYPEFHTPINLGAQVAELYSQYPDMLVVGSLGRATLYSSLRDDPYYEFAQRRQSPLFNGDIARDVDVIGVESELAASTLPFWIDATSYDIDGTQISQENGDWHISVHGFYDSLLHPSVMEPIEGETIYGIPCKTLPAETQLALLTVRGRLREKDITNFSLLSGLVDGLPISQRLGPLLTKPFERVHELNVARAPHLQSVVHLL